MPGVANKPFGGEAHLISVRDKGNVELPASLDGEELKSSQMSLPSLSPF